MPLPPAAKRMSWLGAKAVSIPSAASMPSAPQATIRTTVGIVPSRCSTAMPKIAMPMEATKR